jgi:transposase
LCLKGQARQKTEEILSSMNGSLSAPQRTLFQMELSHLADLQANLQEVEEAIQTNFTQFENVIELLDAIPGIDQTAAFAIVAEIGQADEPIPHRPTPLLLGRLGTG